MLLARHKRKDFFARIFDRTVTGDEKWIHYDNPKKKKSWGAPGHASTATSRIFMEKNSCVFEGLFGVVYYCCSNRTRPLLGLSTEHNE